MTGAPRLARTLLTLVVVLAAGAIAVVAVVAVVQRGWDIGPWWLLSLPAIVLASAAPLYLDRYDDWLVVGTELCVLVFLSLTVAWPQALVLWIAGVVLAQVLGLPRSRRVFDPALSIVCGGLAVAVVAALDVGTFGYAEVLTVLLAFTLAFVVDIGASVVWVHDVAMPAGGALAARAYEVLTLYGVYVGVNAMGYVCVLLYRTESPWALLAVVPALGIVLIAVKGLTRERETARRLNVLFETASALHSASNEAQVLAALDLGVRQLGKTPGSGLRTELPDSPDLRRLFISGDEVFWLVIQTKDGPPASTLRWAEALESIAQQAEEALSRMRMNRDLVANAQRDPLTKLRNRSVFLETVAAEMAGGRAVDTGSRTCAILFCDLDGFKKVNDQFGHASGDGALIEVARRLSAELPADVHLARLGGDEFAILVSSEGGEQMLEASARDVAETVREVVSRPLRVDARSIDITVSIGVATAAAVAGHPTVDTAADLLRNADIAMYAAKRAGRDRVVVYSAAMGVERVRSLELVDRLRRAIDERRLRVVYQPIVSAVDQHLLAIEALARWTEDGEVISPAEFIPLAEDANLIESIGALVLEQVCDDRQQLDHALAPETAIAVNLSAPQLGSAEFVASVERAVEALAPHRLTLEITETGWISEELIASGVMERLLERGVTFAVDDFGVGFSSLERLRRLPVQLLKLDRFFSQEIDTDPQSAAVLASMLEMAAALNLRTVIEGIERQSQVEAIRAIAPGDGGELAFQGYYFGGPMSPATLVRWEAQRSRTASLRRR
ncbi:bifunctional diguanylate cyclase/phosphodiesterase [Mumia sp. ZJ430]|uniref:putative bifunctional diguanylate cyclase/phosphodiesterase n=1 Tax=Mumia sp. ZJ430 TaxID=2708083 RepID=UPI0014246277|nr:bifunctional diguanylate cyclase/phosphodiesterase [Mumia sp. ZJ430]